jgi:hypothetical protein
MKRILMFLGAIMLSSMMLFTACTDDSDPVDLPPSISFVAGTGFISDDETVTVNTPFVVKILAQANATSGAKIQSISITRIFNNQTVGDTSFLFNDATVTFEITFMSYPEAGVENIEFEATDKDGQKDKITLQITTQATAGPIFSWTEKILGSYDDATGSSFASINGTVYTLEQAFANQSLIDWMYWYGASTLATIGAPDDENAALVFNEGTYQLANWTTKNATRFKTTTVAPAAFDAMTDDSDIVDIATGADQTRIGEMAVDQVIAFVTVTGKKGLIKVRAIETGSAGTMTIDVKVQQ